MVFCLVYQRRSVHKQLKSYKHLHLLAPPNCSYIQGDEKALKFSESLDQNKNFKNSNFSRKKWGWYSEPFIFSKTPEVNKNSDSEPAAKKPKQNTIHTNFNSENCPVLQVFISQLQEEHQNAQNYIHIYVKKKFTWRNKAHLTEFSNPKGSFLIFNKNMLFYKENSAMLKQIETV